MRKAYIGLHIAVVLFGFTAILGKLILIDAVSLVWWRVFLTSLSLLLLVRVGRMFRTIPRKTLLQFVGIGCLVALHWITFFGSIKLSNASVGLVTFATTSFFTSLIEPLVLRQKMRMYEVMLGVLIIPAMLLIVRGLDEGMMAGIWVGLVSACLAALFASCNKLLITKAEPLQITCIEIVSAWLFISIGLGVFMLAGGDGVTDSYALRLAVPAGWDWFYLAVLAFLCTTLAYVLALKSLHHLSAYAANLVVNLEPVYGIFLAWVLLKESRELTPGFYGGVALILAVVFLYPLIRRRFSQVEGKNTGN